MGAMAARLLVGRKKSNSDEYAPCLGSGDFVYLLEELERLGELVQQFIGHLAQRINFFARKLLVRRRRQRHDESVGQGVRFADEWNRLRKEAASGLDRLMALPGHGRRSQRQISRKLRQSASRKGLARYSSIVRRSVTTSTSTGMPGMRSTLGASLCNVSRSTATRAR
jgi:hypothetical protein